MLIHKNNEIASFIYVAPEKEGNKIDQKLFPEILYKIFSELEEIDLQKLSFSTKFFRKMVVQSLALDQAKRITNLHIKVLTCCPLDQRESLNVTELIQSEKISDINDELSSLRGEMVSVLTQLESDCLLHLIEEYPNANLPNFFKKIFIFVLEFMIPLMHASDIVEDLELSEDFESYEADVESPEYQHYCNRMESFGVQVTRFPVALTLRRQENFKLLERVLPNLQTVPSYEVFDSIISLCIVHYAIYGDKAAAKEFILQCCPDMILEDPDQLEKDDVFMDTLLGNRASFS